MRGCIATLMGTLIAGWRDAWNLGSFPFYFTQIAPYDYEEPMAAALLREAQVKTLTVPNTGMVVTADIGDVNDIHPKNKQEVGRRLALWALARTYGVNLPEYSGPLYRSMKREGNAVRVFFDHAEGGLVVQGDRLEGCAIAGPDRTFVDADAKIDGVHAACLFPEGYGARCSPLRILQHVGIQTLQPCRTAGISVQDGRLAHCHGGRRRHSFL